MDNINILIGLLLYPFRFLIGLSSIWFEERNSKTFLEILKEYDVQVIVSRGTLSALNLAAAAGAIMMLLFLIIVIIGIFKNGLSHA
ncbi:MAG: hypothetical protein JSU09_09570 [Bacteroidetes bacterium]|nr:hypothetical protein [Bacteroidota bacterium]